MFDYDREAPLGVEEIGVESRGGALVRDITFVSPSRERPVAAYLVEPEGGGPFAGILYAHWYETHADNMDRSQFLDEAVEMATRGAASLLVETMWSRKEWYGERRREEDFEESIKQVVELRRALDVLTSRPGVDPARLAYVGHDFGGMYGTVLAGADSRPRSYVVIAAAPLFSDWYLYGPPRYTDEEKREYAGRMAPLDPMTQIRKAEGAAFLFQFGYDDFYVPEEKANQFFASAPEPKRMEWYGGGHAVSAPEARRDRVEWLGERLGLGPEQANQ